MITLNTFVSKVLFIQIVVIFLEISRPDFANATNTTTTTTIPTTTAPQWAAWENCTVLRVRFRDCNTTSGNCTGSNSQNDTLPYSTCPILSSEDIAAVQTKIETAKAQKLEEIANNTQATINQIKKVYEVSIATSTGFGYIAAIFISLIFSLPFMCDIHKLIVHCCDKKKIHSESSKQAFEKIDANPKPRPKSVAKVAAVNETIQEYVDQSEA